MLRRQENGLVYYQFESLSGHPGLTHGVFTRLGGVSQAPFATLNLGRDVGDAPASIDENYSRICRALGIVAQSLVTGYQVHSDHVAIVGDDDAGQLLPATDALATQSRHVALTLRFADCVPILLFDPVSGAIGIVHAGWIGTLNRIAGRTVEAMTAAFGSRPADVIAGIGPSIGPCCYEIGPDVLNRVRDAFAEPADLLHHRADGRAQLDLWAANQRVLKGAGVRTIETSALCTACHREEFYSHRGEAGLTGRFGAFIAFRQLVRQD